MILLCIKVNIIMYFIFKNIKIEIKISDTFQFYQCYFTLNATSQFTRIYVY